jgi:hypothetical protein
MTGTIVEAGKEFLELKLMRLETALRQSGLREVERQKLLKEYQESQAALSFLRVGDVTFPQWRDN